MVLSSTLSVDVVVLSAAKVRSDSRPLPSLDPVADVGLVAGANSIVILYKYYDEILEVNRGGARCCLDGEISKRRRKMSPRKRTRNGFRKRGKAPSLYDNDQERKARPTPREWKV